MTDSKKSKRGKKSKAQGGAFELRVRKNLEEKGWVVDKWSNNIEFNIEHQGNAVCVNPDEVVIGKIIPAKIAYGFNPVVKRVVPLTRSTGFPDFVAFKKHPGFNEKFNQYQIIGVESKMNGILTREEKQKCKWYLDNNIFSKIFIAEKLKIKNRIHIEYHDFMEKYWNKNL